MVFLLDWFSLTLFLTTGIALLIGYATWQRRRSSSKTLALLMAAIAEWSLCGALEAVAANGSAKVFWAQVSYVGVHSLPPLYLIFAWQYNQRERWLTKRVIVPLWIIPVITMGLAATNGKHHLIWSGFHWATDNHRVLVYEYGPGFWVGALYGYSLAAIASVHFIYAAYQASRLYKGQATLVILAAIIPWAGNILYTTKATPFTNLDLTPVFFLLTGALLAVSMFQYRFLDLTPIARSKVLDTMADAIIVVDSHLRISDLNPAAESLLGSTGEDILGQPAHQALSRWPHLESRFRKKKESPTDVKIIPDREGGWFEARISPLMGQGERTQGWVILLDDITRQRKLESALRAREKLYRSVTESANDGIAIAQNYLIKYSNPQLARMVGYSVEEVVNESFVKFIAPKQVATIQKRHECRMKGEVPPSRYETELLHASGQHIPVEFNVSSIEYNKKPAVLAIVRDISAQKEAEEELHQFARQQRLLNDITRAAIEATELDVSLQILADRLGELIQADGCYITLWDAEKEQTIPAAAYGSVRERYKSIQVDPDEPTLTKAVLSKESLLAIEDVFNTPYLRPERAAQFPSRSLLALPLIVNEHKLGAALIAFEEAHTFTQEEIRLGVQASRHIALMLFNARLVETSRERAQELGILYDVTTTAMKSVHLDEIFDRTMTALQDTLHPDDIAILLVEPETGELVIRAHLGFPGGPTLMRREVGVGVPGWVVETGQPVLLADVRGDERYHGCDLDTRSELCVPLRVGEHIIGAINLESRQLAAFKEDDLRILSILAGHLAVIIKNARLFEEVQRLATIDELTGLNNRRHLFELGGREFKRARRYSQPLSAIMLDIDHFKQVNDTYGHAVGDQVLRNLAQRCLQNMRETDLLGRYGGEEFFLLLPETGLQEAQIFAERLRLSVQDMPNDTTLGKLTITISLGVAELTEEYESLEALIDCADTAMYRAKRRGRNQVVAQCNKRL